MIIPGREVLIKRLPVRIDRADNIQRCDTDNRYLQRAMETMFRSYTLNGIINKLAGFTNGEGFVDQTLNELIVHEDGYNKTTLRKLLDQICFDYSWADGFAIHVQYNLNYTIASCTHIPFEYCRLGIPDDEGCVEQIAYCTNWERDYNKESKERKIIFYDVFNPYEVKEQIEKAGGIEEYKGQIFYYTPVKNQYPKVTFDSVFEQAQTQAEIALFSLYNTVNGFTAGHIFLYPGKFADDTERGDFKKRLQEHKGAIGAASMMVIEAGTSDIKGSDFLVRTDSPNNDKLYEFTLNQCEKAMLQAYGMPPGIIGKMPDTGMFNKEDMENSYTYFNAVTRDRRAVISREFATLFEFWNTPINSTFDIVQQVYDKQAAQAQTAQPTEAQGGIDSIIRSLSRRDVSKIYSYVNDFKNGRSTIEQTRAFLKPFLQTDENVNLFIQDPEGDGTQQ